ncbi:minor capsid protein [Alkalihalobacterium chitinilyticum]|uniref:Minor capsid protein n=1 Tax=Alkalihalobacterium chitinilyticum TaxID=2980103 RepID=A0ABT5VLV8_9BACI|nr:minor capsid protein [Alkalihalobacterium chitinilyticum]MDE5415483.1 minor capsid protein [Alkalihalobacterium chitinilyticum]
MLLIEIARYLHAQRIGVFDERGVQGNIFLNIVPTDPEALIALFSTGGPPGDVKLGYDNPTVQVWLRGDKNPVTAFEKAQEVYNALHGFSGGRFIENGSYIVDCRGQQSQPLHMGLDNNGRHQYSINFILDMRNESRRR